MDNTHLFPRILHGGDYNPEQWPEDVWDDDVRLMQEASVNVATLPVFGWVSLQPSEETWTWDWLDTVLDKLHAGGIGLCLATATASVPAWVDQKYPEMRRVGSDGRRLKHGNRHSFCPNSPNFRRLSVQLAGRMAERYASHPGLLLWHVGNEYGGTCYCDLCAAAFRVWLEARYGTLDALNAQWYTTFWGHTFTDWAQIETPTTNGEGSIQPLSLDYDRFQSESLLNCCTAERDAIRAFSPETPITTNMMGSFKPLDYYAWAKELDVVSWDCYPQRGATGAEIAFQHSLMRGLKPGLPWLLMEQTPSQQNWQSYNALKRPGVMRLWSFQAIAHGADAVMYFQWRRGRGGIEKFHGAVVEHAGRTDARVFQEVATLGRELAALSTQTLGGLVEAKVAVLFDWDNWWAVEHASGPSVDLKYLPQTRAPYAALHGQDIVPDVLSPEEDLSHYKVVIAPLLYMVKPGVAERLTAFVASGGTLVVTFFSGIVDQNDMVFAGGYPGPLKEALGIWVEETDVLSPNQSNGIVFTGSVLAGETVPCGLLCERIHADGAQVLGTYAHDFYAGEPAVTVNTHGDGHAYYLATQMEDSALAKFLGGVCADAGVFPALGTATPDGVEVVPRQGLSGETLLYVLNHNPDPVQVTLPGGVYRELLSGDTLTEQIDLPAYGVCILAVEPAS